MDSDGITQFSDDLLGHPIKTTYHPDAQNKVLTKAFLISNADVAAFGPCGLGSDYWLTNQTYVFKGSGQNYSGGVRNGSLILELK
jgi:hypothetical protein